METQIEFTKEGHYWKAGDTGHIHGFINEKLLVLAIIVLDNDGTFVTSLLQNFKRV
jgi:hypothetical protein